MRQTGRILLFLTVLTFLLLSCTNSSSLPSPTQPVSTHTPASSTPTKTKTPEPSTTPIDKTIVTVTESQAITVGVEKKQVTIARYKGQEVAVDPTAQTGGWYESSGGTWKAWDPENAADDTAYEVKAALLLKASGKNIDVAALFTEAATDAEKEALLALERSAFANWYDLNRERKQYETRMPYAWRHAEIVYMPNYTTVGKWTDYNGRRIFLGINASADRIQQMISSLLSPVIVSDGRVDVTVPGLLLTSTEKGGSLGLLSISDVDQNIAEEGILDFGVVNGERLFYMIRLQYQPGVTDLDDGHRVTENGKFKYEKTNANLQIPITVLFDGNNTSDVVTRSMILEYIKNNPNIVPVYVWSSGFSGPLIVNGVQDCGWIILGQE